MTDFLDALLRADIVVVSGGGDFTDAFERSAVKLLDILDIAGRNGKISGMLGQGLGPIKNPRSSLIDAGKRVFPMLDFITIRENRVGPSLLLSFRVDPSRFTVTGDDAVELAYNERSTGLGTSIGVNLRVSSYSEVGSGLIMILRDCLREASKKYSASLIPVPISLLEQESDISTARELLKGFASPDEQWSGLDTPQKIITQVRNARIVVTGSYHAAVFALAQGIPAVCIAQSEYYVNKFLGLADQFSRGCHLVCADEQGLFEKMRSAINTAWSTAEEVRPHLLAAAMRQIESGRAAYGRIYDILADRHSGPQKQRKG
jgi:colanic acid/amylovoran biosynthesis protein